MCNALLGFHSLTGCDSNSSLAGIGIKTGWNVLKRSAAHQDAMRLFPHIDFQPRAQMKQLFEESELVSGDREAIRKFSDKYIVPEKLVAEHVEHLIQIKMRKEKKKEETETEQMERLNREYNDLDWVGQYNSDKLSSLRVDELSLYFSHHKITFKGKKAEKVAMIKAHIGSLLYDSMESQQPR